MANRHVTAQRRVTVLIQSDPDDQLAPRWLGPRAPQRLAAAATGTGSVPALEPTHQTTTTMCC